jgi:hypothetical protein
VQQVGLDLIAVGLVEHLVARARIGVQLDVLDVPTSRRSVGAPRASLPRPASSR